MNNTPEQMPGPQHPSNPFFRQKKVEGIGRIILVGSGKGGVGKSTVALNIATALKQAGQRVGVLDADIYGPSLPRLTGTTLEKPMVNADGKMVPINRYGLQLMSIGYLIDEANAVVWRGPMLFKAMEQFLFDVTWGELDFLIVDLPPGTGDVALTLAQKAQIAGAILVTTPQNIALSDARKAIDMFNRIQVPVLGCVENMSHMKTADGDTVQLFPKGELDAFLESKGIGKLAQLPFDPSVGLSCEAGIPYCESSRESETAQQFNRVAQTLSEGSFIQADR